MRASLVRFSIGMMLIASLVGCRSTSGGSYASSGSSRWWPFGRKGAETQVASTADATAPYSQLPSSTAAPNVTLPNTSTPTAPLAGSNPAGYPAAAPYAQVAPPAYGTTSAQGYSGVYDPAAQAGYAAQPPAGAGANGYAPQDPSAYPAGYADPYASSGAAAPAGYTAAPAGYAGTEYSAPAAPVADLNAAQPAPQYMAAAPGEYPTAGAPGAAYSPYPQAQPPQWASENQGQWGQSSAGTTPPVTTNGYGYPAPATGAAPGYAPAAAAPTAAAPYRPGGTSDYSPTVPGRRLAATEPAAPGSEAAVQPAMYEAGAAAPSAPPSAEVYAPPAETAPPAGNY